MTHIFVVNDQTFKYHLEYLFAGTCAKSDSPFLRNPEYHNPRKKEDGVTARQELSIAGMIADVSRIRPGDRILFYLTEKADAHEGQFFGVFRATERAFFDSDDENYLSQELGVKLHFRVCVEAETVYPYGVSENEALDRLDGITHPSQMCWSLIYRKLKGKRGCTMVTDYEADRLIRLIESRNQQPLLCEHFSFNENICCIVQSNEIHEYAGAKDSLDLTPRIFVRAARNNAYEAHLQAFLLQNCDAAPLNELTGQRNALPLWIGNEVSCGVGMQSIDTMFMQEDDENVYINIIELKCVDPYVRIITHQLPRYISWVKDYIVPLYSDKQVYITPTILARKISNEQSRSIFVQKCATFPSEEINNLTVKPIEYIGYTFDENIHFEKII